MNRPSLRRRRQSAGSGLSAMIMAALMVMFASMATAKNAHAQPDEADCGLFEIRASKGTGGIDPALKALQNKLKKPPFDSWSEFKLLAKHQKKLARGKALELKLSPGGKVTVLYRDRSDAKNKKPRLRLSLTLDDKNGKR